MIPFHRLLISTAILFCAGLAVGEGLTLVMALSAAVAAAALTYYLRHLKRFLGR
jgi:hypothetical protein